MVLRHTQRIRIAGGQERLKITLDVVLDSKPTAQVKHPMGVIFPVGRIGHGKVICPPDFVEVNELMGFSDDSQAGRRVKRWLQADPCEDTRFVEGLQGGNAITRKGGSPLPLAAKGVVKAGKGRGESVPVWPVQIEKRQRPASAFGQGAEGHPVGLDRFNRGPGQACVKRVERVGCEAEHDLLSYAKRLVFAGVGSQAIKEVGPGRSACVEAFSAHAQNVGDIAVGAFVAAATIGVSRQGGILSCLAFGGVDNGASVN